MADPHLIQDQRYQLDLSGETLPVQALQALGITGTIAGRYVGSTASGAPSGTFVLGDFAVSQDGNVYICTTAPNTFTAVGGSAISFGTPGLTLSTTNSAGSGTATGTVRYKISGSGQVTMQIPSITATQATTLTVTLTGVPAALAGGVTQVIPGLVVGTSAGGVIVPGLLSLAPAATVQGTGTMTLSQYTSLTTGFTGTFTTAVSNGIAAQTVTYDLF